MKDRFLDIEELANLSSLLVSPNKDNIEVGFQILESYPNHIKDVSKELVLISQLSWYDLEREKARNILEKNFSSEENEAWDNSFRVFHIYTNLFSSSEFEQEWMWFEKHEQIRLEFMPLIAKNKEFAGEYFAVADSISEYYKKKLDWAERYYHIPLVHNPHDLNALFTLANLYRDVFHNYKKALVYYDKMLEISPQHYDALESKGILLFEFLKQPPLALELFQQALVYYPNDAQFEVWLADCYMHLNEPEKYKKGKDILEQILKQNPKNIFAWTIYANRLWTTEKNPVAAQKAYLDALKFAPRNYNILGNLAELHSVEYQDYEKAQVYYIKAFSIYTDDTFHLSNYISMLVLQLKKLMDAKDYYIHLRELFFDEIKRDSDLNDKQWQEFKEAEQLLWQKFPILKEL